MIGLIGGCIVCFIQFPMLKFQFSNSINCHRWLALFLAGLFLVIPMTRAFASENQSNLSSASVEIEKGEHSLPQAAVHLIDIGPWNVGGYNLGPLSVTNSILVTWIVAIFIIIFAQVAMRNVKEVPEGAQNFWEWLVEGLYNFLETIIGHELVKKTFWFFATIFIFILFTNWCGLIPGVGTIGWGYPDAAGALHHIDKPIFRGANADLNMTFAMSMIFFLCWIVWAIQANGFGGFILHIFGPKGDTKGLMKVLMVVVFIVVGLLEVVSILFRPISLSFRLYGNMFAGERILEAMSSISHWFSWLIPIPFYFMELLVGLLQALVFMLLTAVFTLLICKHEEGHH
jgi:F-type H+-transporting ATPase subunit a